jgi:cell wall assembly regulator SMI1
MQPGASSANLAALERRYPAAPASLVELFRWHDGELGRPQSYTAVRPLLSQWYFPTLERVFHSADTLDDLATDPYWMSTRIQWNSGWVPFLEAARGDHLCVDTNDSLEVGSPSVVYFDHEVEWRTVYAPTFDAWLDAFTDSLDEGLWKLDEQGELNLAGKWDAFEQFLAARHPGFPRNVEAPFLDPPPDE